MHARLVALRSGTDRAANRAAASAAIEDARSAGADLVVLPEYASAFDPRGVAGDLAEPITGEFVGALASASRGLAVLAGTMLPAPDGRALNTVVALADGRLLGSYAKVHLYDAFGVRESDRLVPGPADAPPLVLDLAGLRIGVLTCYDLRFPESARRLVDAGAQVLVVPAAWAAGEHKADHWLTLLRSRAIENTAYVLGAAMRGPGVVGDPVAIDPWGVVVAGGPGLDVVDVDLDPAVVDQVRTVNPSLANRRYRVVPR